MYTDRFGKEHKYGPPQGWVQPASESLGPADWDALVARGLKFEPYDGPRIKSKAYGTCLDPLLTAHEYLELRPVASEELLVNDGLYTIEPENQEEMRQLIQDKLGRSITGNVSITKFLRFVAGEWWYINREGIDRLGNGAVIYEVVGFIPKTGPRAGQSSTPTTHGGPSLYVDPIIARPECSQVGLNAATSTLTSSLSAGSVGSFTTPNVQGSVTVGPFGIDTTVILTVTGQWQFTYSGGTIQNMSIRYGISTVSTISFTGALVTVDQSTAASSTVTGSGPVSQEIQVSLLAGTTTTYNVLAGQNPSGILGTAINITGIIKAEVIKR
jgi:hypothetical protein